MNRLQTPQRPAPKGFSLLELLCAIFVISTGLTVALCGHFSSRDHLRENEARLMALTALENELETLRALPYSHLSTGAGQAFQSGNPMLDRLVDAACVTAIEEKAPGLKRVQVAIRWRGGEGRTKSETLSTLIADKE